MSAKWDVSWSPVDDEFADSYNVYRQADKDGVLTLVTSAKQSKASIELPDSDEIIIIWIVPVIGGEEVSEQEWSKIEIRPNDLSDIPRPADVASFAVSQDGEFLCARWDEVSDPNLSHYEIRRGATWESAIKVADCSKGKTSARWGWMGSGEYTYTIKAISVHRQESENANQDTLTITVPESLVEVTTGTEDPAFAGTGSGTEVTGGALLPEQRAALWSDQHTPALWSDWTGAPWWWKFEQNPTYTTPAHDNGSVVDEIPKFDVVISPIEKPGMTWDDWHGPRVRGEINDSENSGGYRTPFDETEFHDLNMVAGDIKLRRGCEMKIEVQLAQDGVPTWGSPILWIPGTRYRYRQIRFIITLITRVGWWYPSISGLTWRLYRRNFKQEKKIEITATGGTVVAWDRTFTATPVVTASAVYAGVGLFATVEAISTTQATVRLFNAAGTETTGDVEVHALGY